MKTAGAHSRALTALLLAPLAALHGASVSTAARDFQSLDGAWQIVFDRANAGAEKGWIRDDRFPSEQSREIPVPSCWELVEKDYEGVAFYRRTFKAPAHWKGKVVRLQFDAVNFRAEVWWNDTALGFHEGGFTPFEFRVDDLLKFDEDNTLILRVVGPILMQDKRVDGVGPLETPQWRGAITGGIWQPVRLVATGAIYVKDVFIEPKISDHTATFHLELAHGGEESASARIELVVRSGDHIVARTNRTLDLKPGPNRQDWP